MQNYWTNQVPVTPVNQYQVRPIIDWAVGKAAADAYPMAPNGKVMLLDTQEPVMYVKTTDSMGRPSVVIFDLVERVATAEPAPAAPQVDYDQIRGIVADEVKKQIASYAKKGKKEVAE